ETVRREKTACQVFELRHGSDLADLAADRQGNRSETQFHHLQQEALHAGDLPLVLPFREPLSTSLFKSLSTRLTLLSANHRIAPADQVLFEHVKLLQITDMGHSTLREGGPESLGQKLSEGLAQLRLLVP